MTSNGKDPSSHLLCFSRQRERPQRVLQEADYIFYKAGGPEERRGTDHEEAQIVLALKMCD